MNIEQIQARIQNYPIPLLQQYANGANPEVPGWLALSVLQQKEAMGRQVTNAQGAAQGQMPTVKQQLEQKLGTMQQQASMQPQGLVQAQTPPPQGPVQGEPMQAASGGLMSGNAGNSMKFAEGGIIGFSDGGKGDKYETQYDRSNRENREEGTAGLEPFLRYIRAPLDAAADVARLPVSLVEHMAYNGKGESPSWTPAMDDRTRYLEGLKNSPEAVQARAERVTPTPVEPPTTGQDPATGQGNYMGSRRTPAQVAANPTPPGAQGLGAARVPPTAASAAPAPDSMEAMLRAGLANRPAAPTVEGTAGTVRDMQKQFGVDQPAGAEERAMIAQMNQRYAQGKEGQGLRNLQSVLAASGRGYGAMGQEDVRLHNAETAADMAHQKAIYDLTHGINTANRAEQVSAMNKGLGMYGDQEKLGGEFDRTKLTALASAYHTKEAAAAQLLAARISAMSKTDPAEALRLKYLDQQQDSLVSELNKLPQFGPGVKEQRAAKEAKLLQIRKELQKATGIDIMTPTPGATGAGGPPPPGAVREVKR